ncbi:MAG: hypothetical protein AAGJ51_07080 [Pseudomonadota bacterium]
MSNTQRNLLKVVAILWIIWGLVHMLAGLIVIPADASAGFAAIADAIPAEALRADYHAAVGGILNQHAWNLLWGGFVTVVGAIFIWRGNTTAIWVTAMIGGLLDFGYFVFVDIPGFVHFVPGTLMTLVSSAAILISFYAWYASTRQA